MYKSAGIPKAHICWPAWRRILKVMAYGNKFGIIIIYILIVHGLILKTKAYLVLILLHFCFQFLFFESHKIYAPIMPL